VAAFEGLNKFKVEDVVMVTKVQKMYLESKFRPIRRFLYFGGHFGFKMDAIANRSGRNVVQHILNKFKMEDVVMVTKVQKMLN
jgi:predicted GTPase